MNSSLCPTTTVGARCTRPEYSSTKYSPQNGDGNESGRVHSGREHPGRMQCAPTGRLQQVAAQSAPPLHYDFN